MFSVLPVVVNALVERLGLTIEQAGLVASIDLAGLFCGQILTAALIRSMSARKLALIGFCLFSGGNLLTAFTTDFYTLCTVRFFSDIGGGIFIALCMTYLTRSSNPDRYIGLSVGLQLTLTICLLLVAPSLLQNVGFSGFFLLLTALSLVTILSVKYPLDIEFEDKTAVPLKFSQFSENDKDALIGVISILVYWVGIGACWSFMEVIGVEKGYDNAELAQSLALSQVAGFTGALFTAWLGNRYGRLIPTLIALSIKTLVIVTWFNGQSLMWFSIGISVFSFTWNVVLIYQLAMVAKFDKKGVFMSVGTSAQALGVAIGPAIVAMTLVDTVVLPVAITAFVAIFMCTFFSIVINRRIAQASRKNDSTSEVERNFY